LPGGLLRLANDRVHRLRPGFQNERRTALDGRRDFHLPQRKLHIVEKRASFSGSMLNPLGGLDRPDCLAFFWGHK
jgi:hypothetical protein